MELLELQARARAIRSQLALEPVTKIELDSDNDSADSSSPKTDKNSTSTAATSDKNKDPTNKTKSSTVVQVANGIQIIKPSVPAVKPVRLKRNFRQRQNDDYDPDEDDGTKSVENCALKEPEKPSADEKDETTPDNVKSDEAKRDETERSPSPDLIPIVQEPETYCISSDSDEAGSSSVPKYITYPTVVREKLPETEDEKFLKKIKEGSGTDLRNLIKSRRGGGGTTVENAAEISETIVNDVTQSSTEILNRRRSSADKNVETSNEQIPVVESENKIDTEPEEGELTDGDDQDELEVNQITISSDEENDEKSNKCDSETVTQAVEGVSENIKDESSSESSSSDNDSDTDSSDAPIFKEADDDDDIIDLGKDEELDFEMKEVERSETKNKKLKKTKKKLKVADKPNETVSEAKEEIEVNEETKGDEDVSQGIEITDSTEKDASKDIESDTVADPVEVIL